MYNVIGFESGVSVEKAKRRAVIAWVLLGVSIFFWILALLFQLRVTGIFHRIIVKRLGMVFSLGMLSILPLAAAILGIRMLRARQAKTTGILSTVLGAGFVLLFVFLIGCPMLRQAFEPQTPKNPSTPRPVAPQTGLAVFPGAEGFGTRTPAGRGGKVIEVTSLADGGPGTLREALDHPGPRIIVFRISGTIEVKGELYISHPFVTVAGQTALGGGICIKGAGIAITSHDVLVQHIRVRPGNKGPVDADINDAIAILGKHGSVDGAYNVVMDHVSASWGEDETVSTWYGAHDITISRCIISEALNRSRHHKETHSAGLLIGDGSYHVSVHHCLLAHNDFRNPLISKGGTHDFVNNVIYDWGVLPAEISDEDSNSFLNFVGNYFLPGPSTQEGNYEILISPGKGAPKIYVEGNIGPHRPDASVGQWALVGYGYGDKGVAPDRYRAAAPFKVAPVLKMKAGEAYEKVLSEAGATRPERDAVDIRVVSEVRSRTGRIIDSPEDAGGYPELAAGEPPKDTDHDGMPDEWERKAGLNPDDPSDGGGDADGDGYTNIEEYLHSLLKH